MKVSSYLAEAALERFRYLPEMYGVRHVKKGNITTYTKGSGPGAAPARTPPKMSMLGSFKCRSLNRPSRRVHHRWAAQQLPGLHHLHLEVITYYSTACFLRKLSLELRLLGCYAPSSCCYYTAIFRPSSFELHHECTYRLPQPQRRIFLPAGNP